MHCLEKSPQQRFQTARDVAFALEALSGLSSNRAMTAGMHVQAERPKNHNRLGWILAGVCFGLLAALPFAIAYLRRAPKMCAYSGSPCCCLRSSHDRGVNVMVVSPDGRRLAFIASLEGREVLWVRSLNSPLSTSASRPEERRAILLLFGLLISVYWVRAGGKLKKIDASGGPPQTLCDAIASRGGTWNREGVIVFAPGGWGPLYQVSAAGGQPSPVTALDQSRFETSHRWPFFLPDGKHFVYFARSNQLKREGYT